ncbi:MAG: hypothetical protein KDB10_18410 [Acidimicrobiales bacterium]|nr:hypothetical protein [Acidimicrobiales bacterium]
MKVAAIVAGMVLLVLALGEIGARAFSPYLPEPLLWSDRSTQVKVAQMDRLRREQGCVDVAFVGNSMTRDAIDPATFSAADPDHHSAYNAALDAATPALLSRWTLEEVEPRLDPATVVLGLSSFDLNDEARIAASALESYDTATLSRGDLFGRLQAPFVEHSDLFRFRNELRDPTEVWSGIQRLRRGETTERLTADGIDGIIGPDGEGLSRRDLRYTGSVSIQRFAQTELLNDFDLGGVQIAAAEGLVSELHERGVEVALVVLPITEDYVGLHPDGGADYQRFLVATQRLAERTGAVLVDAHAWAPGDASFADTHHLNGDGALAFSAALPGLLAEAGAPTPTCAP